MSHGDRDAGPLRLAIVGVGPKGLFALERLLDHARRTGPDTLLEIDLFDPHPAPGAGPVYDPAQPAYLRMNLAATHLDLWGARSRAVPDEQRRSFIAWRRDLSGDDGPSDEAFPARALVGRYLADGLARMRVALRPGISITLRRAAVRAIERRDRNWSVVPDGDAFPRDYDEVVVAVGHATLPDDRDAGPWPHAVPLIEAVFPVTRWLTAGRVAPGATIAVRGFALTFLDAAIALTEGRGGMFEADDHAYRLRYAPSEHDPALILPFSRSGRPMLAKPEPALAAGVPALEEIARSGRAEILALPEARTSNAGLVAVLATATAAGLLAASGRARSRESMRRAHDAAAGWLRAAGDGRPPAAGIAPADEIERSLAVGAGSATARPAVGARPHLAQPVPGDRRASRRQRPAAARMARRSAGSRRRWNAWPSARRAVNAAKLLALVAAGRVDLDARGRRRSWRRAARSPACAARTASRPSARC